MGEKESKVSAKKELSYEELKNIAGQLQQQNKFLIEQLQKNDYTDLHKRIEYLFKVLEHKSDFLNFDSNFFDDSVNEIISILKIDKNNKSEVTEKE